MTCTVASRFATLTVVGVSLWVGSAGTARGQSDGQRRQAAAEAYDRGTADYLAGNYARAAEWFETANRMAPAAPALMQAVRAHRRAGNDLRAATLALGLTLAYGDEPAALEYATQVLDELQGNYLRVEVACDDCTVDLNGTLQEYHSFFVEPDATHTVVAHFDTGDEQETVSGASGEVRKLVFEAPTGGPGGTVPPDTRIGGIDDDGRGDEPPPSDEDRKPLSPLITYIAGGVTLALGAGVVISGVDALADVEKYEEAADEAKVAEEGGAPDATDLRKKAEDLYEKGHDKEVRTNILIGVTAAAAVGTAVVALFFTDWEGEPESETSLSFSVRPGARGAVAALEGSF